MHDAISRFSCKLNGVYLRGFDDDHVLFSLSYCLNKMRCDVTGVEAAQEITSNAASVAASDSSAYHMVDR